MNNHLAKNTTSQSSVYSIEMQRLLNSALTELEAAHQAGKLADTPIVNTHFLVRWVARSLKEQNFDRSVKDDLIRWQKLGRSKGTASELLKTFRTYAAFYARYLPVGAEPKPIKDKQIDAFLDFMEQQDWSVSTEFDLTSKAKIKLTTDGYHSLVLCTNQCDSCFDGGEVLVRPMSFFVRGDHAQFIQLATQSGFLLHKRTDYKSVVKYHGEYLIYPDNQGPQLAEVPLNFVADSNNQ